MIKKNKWTLIIASIVILLPAVAGIILWDKLPDVMTTHWGGDGVADGFSGKAFAVFGLPLILLVLFWVCVLASSKDPNAEDHNNKMMKVVLWLMPVLSVVVSFITYAIALDVNINIPAVFFILMSVMFLVIGNYLPKCRRSRTMGIKLPWTLSNDENWNTTHRFGGKVWMLCGLAMLACMFLPLKAAIYTMVAILLTAILLPMLYSWLYYRKQAKDGTVPEKADGMNTKADRAGKIITAIFVPIILVGVGILMFTGNIDAAFGDDSFTVNATYYGDAVVEYSTIDSAEYRTDFDCGVRVYGYGSPRLSLGEFECDELGRYTLYSYTGFDECVLLTSGDKQLVIALKDNEATRAFYDELMERIG